MKKCQFFLMSSHLRSQSINSFLFPLPRANIACHLVLFLFGCGTQLGGFLFPDQRLNRCPPAVEVWSLHHWTARELPPLQSWIIIIFSTLVLFDLNLVCILLPSYYSLKNSSHWISNILWEYLISNIKFDIISNIIWNIKKLLLLNIITALLKNIHDSLNFVE